MSKFAIYSPTSLGAGAIAWLLAQTLWVGGLWLLHFLVLPALGHWGLAPLLVEEIGAALSAVLVGLTLCCAVLQLLVLIRAQSLRSLWRDLRGQLLLTVLLAAAAYLGVLRWWPDARQWLLFGYMVLVFCGMLLVLQPVPGRRA